MDKVSIIFPVYNEKETIEHVLKEWEIEFIKQKVIYEFVVCEDGSTDGTSEFLKKIKEKYNLNLNQAKKRRGYGGAVIDGIRSAKYKYLLSIDSDGQCDPKDFTKFWKNRNKADILIGWRTIRADAIQRKLFSTLFKIVFKILFPTTIHDPSAPFVLYKKKTILPYLKYYKFLKEGFWWGFIGTAVKKNLTIYELPINHRNRLNGETVVYKANKIPSIAIRNLIGLFKIKFSA
jgi:glycosyltransferase involved in cell wall biosynthesis